MTGRTRGYVKAVNDALFADWCVVDFLTCCTLMSTTDTTRRSRCCPYELISVHRRAGAGQGCDPAKHASNRRGFTLIEVMVVIVVIAMLATLVAPNVFHNLFAAKDGTARSQMEMLSAALDAYRLDNGGYPTTEQGLGALWAEPALEPRPRAWSGPYLRKQPPPDPWGNAYVYRFPGEENQAGFDLLTYGADGQPGGAGDGADIRAWE